MKHLLFAVTLILFIRCSGNSDVGAPERFNGCDDIQNFVTKSWAKQQAEKPMSGGHVSADATSGGAGANTHLNLQERGVDESDMLRIEEHQLFVTHLGGIEVLKRNTLQKIGVINTAKYSRTRLFTTPSRLIVIGSNDFKSTAVATYKLNGSAMPHLLSETILKGGYIDARRVGDRLVLALIDYETVKYSYGTAPTVNLDGNGQISGVACGCVLPPPDFHTDYSLTKIASFNIEDPKEQPSLIGFLGSSEHVYMSLANLYVAGRVWNKGQTRIVKVGLEAENGVVSIKAKGNVDGYVKDRWAFKEFPKDQILSVVATSGGWTGMSWTEQGNHLETLSQTGEELKRVAITDTFGLKEDIRAVRYVGDLAYAVTFEKTDPLFAIDLSNLREPKILGELMVPGFSAYLHPFKEGKLIGVGFDAKDMGSVSWFQGIQVSLFDTKNPMALKRLDNKLIGVRGSFSDPTADAHAFYSDPERNRIGVPLVELGGELQNNWSFGDKLVFSGAILYHVSETLTETARLSHSAYIPETCKTLMSRGQWWQQQNPSYDINRLVNLDGRLLSVSRFGLVSHCLQDPTMVQDQIVFGGAEEENACKAALTPVHFPD